MAFRDISNSTNQRTAIATTVGFAAMSNKAPLLSVNEGRWIQAIRGITTTTNERTSISASLAARALGNSVPVIDYESARAVASALVLSNMNSLPFDWAARLSVGGSNLNFFIVKQLPVFPPDKYLEQIVLGKRAVTWVEVIIPRVLKLTYTAFDLEGFARDLGYEGQPFPWDEDRRHRLKSELDAIYAQMYGLEREELTWILDAPAPSSSFPTLKRNEISEFGEYRTERYVLAAFDALQRREHPDLDLILD